jgi:hypothetical protein
VKETNPRSVEGWRNRPLEDAELVGLATRGDVRAYEELVERHRDIAVRTAFLVARDATDAEDAVQEAFVKAYAALHRFRQGAPFRPWILRIVANEARNRARSARRRAGLALRAAADRPVEEAAASGPWSGCPNPTGWSSDTGSCWGSPRRRPRRRSTAGGGP